MDITAGIIIYSLSLDTTIHTNVDIENDLAVEAYGFWEQEIPRDHVLYIADKADILENRGIWRKKFVICNGGLEGDPLDGQDLYWISVSESVTLYELAGLVQRAFHQYLQWHIRLGTLIRKKASLSDMLETLYATYRITGCIATQSMEIIGISSHFIESNSWIDPRKMVALDMVNELATDEDFRDAAKHDDVFLYQNMEQEWYYCYNLKIDRQYQARLIANIESHEKSYGMWKLIHDLGACISDIIEDHLDQGQFSQSGREWNELLCSLIQGREIDINDLCRLAKRRCWDIHHEFQVILFQFQDGASGGVGMDYYKTQIKILFQDCCVVRESDRFVCIRDLTRSRDQDDVYEEELPYFLRDTLCKAGISDVFSDLSCLRRYCLEAERALLIGGRMDSTQWYYPFSRYAIPYMMEQCTRELTAEDVCHPAVSVLKAYDAGHDAQLLESLEIFLRERQNITYTARLLDIHRTTLLARLERIRQLTGIRLDHYETCLHLMISFEILKTF